MKQIKAFERERLWPGAVAAIITTWSRFVHVPDVVLWRTAVDGQDDECPYPDRLESRDELDLVLNAVDARARRELRRLVQPWDDLFEARTHHDPQTPRSWPWWRRRA